MAVPPMSLAGKVHRPLLANHHHLDLSGILQLPLDAPRDLLAERGHAEVIDVVRIHDHSDLPAGLYRVHLFHPRVTRGDALETLQTLHVGFEGLAPRPGPRS